MTDPAVTDRLVRVYVDAIDDWGRRRADLCFASSDAEDEDPLLSEARALVRSLQRDGAPVDDEGNLVLAASAPALAVERFDRLREPACCWSTLPASRLASPQTRQPRSRRRRSSSRA